MGGRIFFHNAFNNCLRRMGAFFYLPCQTKICVHYSQASRKRLTAACVSDQSLFLFHQITLHHFTLHHFKERAKGGASQCLLAHGP